MTVEHRAIDERARAAAHSLRRATAVQPPSLTDVIRVSRLRRVTRVVFVLGCLAVGAGIALAAAAVAASPGLRWLTALVLLGLLASTWVLCAHAGGHAWFVPLPALVLAIIWMVTASDHHDVSAGWALAALSAAAAAAGTVFGGITVADRLRRPGRVPTGVVGAAGVAVTPLRPVGVVKVRGETWTAASLSGPLAEGTAVHVASVDGLRLHVWSEDGQVPGAESLESGSTSLVEGNEEET